jgi:hypothetical protein
VATLRGGQPTLVIADGPDAGRAVPLGPVVETGDIGFGP